MSHPVVHFEIPADDVARARQFYRDVFDWNVDEMPGFDYTMVGTAPADDTGRPTEPGTINGGMMIRQDPITTPVITVQVDDMDSAIAKIEASGGRRATGKQAVGDMGFAGYFYDSEGNLMGLWQNRTN